MSGTSSLTRLASLTFFMQSLDTTMLYLALPSMALSLGQPTLNMEWVIVLYMLTVIIVTPVSGWLTERWGARRIYVLAASLFILGSLCCAMSPSLFWLSLFRVIQGIGGALMLPIVKVLILKVSTPSKQLSRLNNITLLGLLGTFVGPVLSGVLISYLSWRYIFIINLPIGLLCLYLNLKYTPARFDPAGRFDFHGFLLLVSALSLIILGLTGINKLQIPYSLIGLFFVGALFLLWCYGKNYLHTRQSQLSLSLFKIRTFSVSIASNIAVRICLSAIPLFISLMLQQEFSYSPVEVSLIMLAMAAGSIIARFFLCQILILLGYRNLLLVSTIIAALFVYQLSRIGFDSSLYVITFLMFLIGIISSILYATLNTLTFSDLTDKTYSTGNSILIITQLVSITLSVTLSFAVIRLLAVFSRFESLDHYRGLFMILSGGLALCCLIFMRLKKNDGSQLLQQ